MIGIAIIGYGYWGPNLARCFGDTEGCRIVAIADPSPAALVRAAKRFPTAQLLNDWRAALSIPGVDALAIATPVRTHYEIADAALRSGRHVLLEKPMTETSDQAMLLIEEAGRRNLVLLVDHTFVYSPAVQAIHRLTQADELGELWYYQLDAHQSRPFPARRERDLGSGGARSLDFASAAGTVAGQRIRQWN